MLVVTIDHVPGYEIVEVLGDVLGATARPQNTFLDGARSLSGVRGGQRQADMLGSCRQEAVNRLAGTAHQRGANAVIGMRFDHRNIGTWIEICAYGTAVVVTLARR